MSTRDERFRKYIDSLHLMNDETISVGEKFRAFCQTQGDDVMLKFLKQRLKFNYNGYGTHNFSIIDFHRAMESVQLNPNKHDITNSNTTILHQGDNREVFQKHSSFTYRGLRVKDILCCILSFLDIDSFATAIMVNRQWFHDSYDCTFGDTLDVDHSKINSSHLSQYLKRYYKCHTIIASASILESIIGHWENFTKLKHLDINFNFCEASTLLSMLACIASKSDDLEYLKMCQKAENRYNSYDSYDARGKITDEAIDKKFWDCEFNNLQSLHLLRMMPILYIYSQNLQCLVIDIWDEQMNNFNTFLEEFYCNTQEDEMENESLQHRLNLGLKQLELCVSRKESRMQRRRSRPDNSDDDEDKIDDELVIQGDLLSNFAYLLQNVEKLKIHCPFVNIFKLLETMSLKAEKYINNNHNNSEKNDDIDDIDDTSTGKNDTNDNITPKLEEIDIRLELTDNAEENRKPINGDNNGDGVVDLPALTKDPFKNLKNLKKVTIYIDDDWNIENQNNISNLNSLLSNAEMVNFIDPDESYDDPYRYLSNQRGLLQMVSRLGIFNVQDSSFPFLQCIKIHQLTYSKNQSLLTIMNLFNKFKQLIDTKVNLIPIYFEVDARIDEALTFSQLNNDIPKFIEILQYIVERSWVNFSIKFSYSTPKGTFDSFNQPMLKSLNIMQCSRSELLARNMVNVYCASQARKQIICQMGDTFLVRNV